MPQQQLIDKIYHIAKHEYHNKSFTFDTVWKKSVKEDKLSKEEQKTHIGRVYTDLLQDIRFVYVGNKKWMLREFAKQEEIEKYQNALYDFNTNIVEEGYVPPAVEEEQTVVEEDDASKTETEEDMDVKESLSKTKLDDEEENEGV